MSQDLNIVVTAPAQAMALVQHVHPINIQINQPASVTIAFTGTAIQGPPGLDGVQQFYFTQNSASQVWTINHNLNRPVIVTAYDNSGNLLMAEVQHYSLNQARLNFCLPISGTAIVS